jgi:gluconokinase
MSARPKAVVLMGVSGCGKTSVGKELSRILGWPFLDGDEFHPPENVTKMASGNPLDDADRVPWLRNLHDLITEHLTKGQSLLLACSALKQKYRDQLAEGNPDTIFVYLKGDFDLIFRRMQSREGHYMKPEMLKSQFATLEEPSEALIIDIANPVGQIAETIVNAIK